MDTTYKEFRWGKMPKGSYRSVTLKEELVQEVSQLISRVKRYRSIAEFVSEAVRLRIEAVEKQVKIPGEEKI